MSALLDYIAGWDRHDVDGVLRTLTADCVIIECYGPVYRGRDRVEQWMRAWFGAGGVVNSWEVTWHGDGGGFLAAEWRFGCTWQGDTETFEGASIARLQDGKIAYLREFATTAPLYDWTGEWHE